MLPPPRLQQPLRRVVVTGLGCASPLGGTAAESWRRAQRGESAAAQFDIDGASFVAARCGDLALDEKREKARVVALALRAAAEAVRDAGGLEAHAPARRGASIASGVGGLGDIVDAAHRVAGGKKLSPFFVPRALCNTAAGAVSLEHSCAGPVQTSAAACAAGAQSVGDAFRLVQRGDCDVALCGGAEACVDEVALRGFARMGALSRDGAARPFDAARSGFVLGEGAAVLVLEDAASAARRGARAYAELRGYGLGGDAVHMSAPPPDGAGVLRAARAALGDAGLEPALVDHVNAHAAGTPAGDAAELAALEALLEGRRGDALVLRRPFVCLLCARLRGLEATAPSALAAARHRRDQSNAGRRRRRLAEGGQVHGRRLHGLSCPFSPVVDGVPFLPSSSSTASRVQGTSRN